MNYEEDERIKSARVKASDSLESKSIAPAKDYTLYGPGLATFIQM
jgi:hypothetical protein